METKIIICGCGDTSHHLIFTPDEEDPEVWLYYQLDLKPWYKRIFLGFKYIFGFQSKYGMYGELLINETNIDKFEEIIDHIKNFKI